MTGFFVPGYSATGTSPPGADTYPAQFSVADMPDLPAEWLLEIGDPSAPSGVLRMSQRGWIGEPGDPQRPNVAYLARMMAPPTLVRSIRILPEDSARLTFQSGEAVLDNADGGLDQYSSQWAFAGLSAVLLRGAHRTPFRAAYSEFSPVADLRVVNAPLSSARRLTLALRAATSDLSVPVCTVYAGTGGLEGDAALAGQSRPLVLGVKRNIAPQPLLAAALVWQIGAGPLAEVGGVRDRGVGLRLTADHPTLEALLAAVVPPGRYATCLAHGLIRLGSTPGGQVTTDARTPGDTSHAAIALALLRGPGGVADDRINPAAFTALVPGVAGYRWTGGTVAAALDDVVAGSAGWWGSDRLGRFTAGRIIPPDLMPARVSFDRWMLSAEPAEIAGVVPRWRQRVTYRDLGITQSATDLAGIVASDPAAVAYFGTQRQVAVAADPAIQAAYPAASDPAPLVTGLDAEGDAAALATILLALHGVPRRRWQVQVGKFGHLVELGDVIAVDHPRLIGRNWIVAAADEAGDTKTLTLWG